MTRQHVRSVTFPSPTEGMQWYLLTADGLQQMTQSAEFEDFTAQWSADGARILLEKERGDIVHPALRLPPGVSITYLPESEIALPTSFSDRDGPRSPDGRRRVFERDSERFLAELVVADMDGSHEVVLGGMNVWESPPVWSPDGAKIAWVNEGEYVGEGQDMMGNPDYRRVLCVANADGTDKRTLVDLDRANLGEIMPGWPAWSADGRQIAISSWEWDGPEPEAGDDLSGTEMGSTVYVVDVDTGDVRQVTDVNGMIFGYKLFWRPVPR